MKVIAINGSPRKNGNTELLLKVVLKPIAESGWKTELIQIGGKTIQGCCGCHKCWEKKIIAAFSVGWTFLMKLSQESWKQML